jgi:hypothetical protein
MTKAIARCPWVQLRPAQSCGALPSQCTAARVRVNVSVRRQTPHMPYSSATVGTLNWQGTFFRINVQVELPRAVQLEAEVGGRAWEDSVIQVLWIRAPEGSGVTAELARAAPGTVREALQDHFRAREDGDFEGVLYAIRTDHRQRPNALSLAHLAGFARAWLRAADTDATTLGLRRNDAVGRFRKLATARYRDLSPEKVRYRRHLCVKRGLLNADGTAGPRLSEFHVTYPSDE